MSPNIDTGELKTLAHSNPTAEGIFLDLSYRKRSKSTTNLSIYRRHLLNKGVRVVEEDYFNTFKKLEETGIGDIIYGRKGNPDLFRWHYSLKEVAKIAIEGSSDIMPQKIGYSDLKNPKKQVVRNVITESGDCIQIIIPKELFKLIKTKID